VAAQADFDSSSAEKEINHVSARPAARACEINHAARFFHDHALAIHHATLSDFLRRQMASGVLRADDPNDSV
jgi:hypothetical protein